MTKSTSKSLLMAAAATLVAAVSMPIHTTLGQEVAADAVPHREAQAMSYPLKDRTDCSSEQPEMHMREPKPALLEQLHNFDKAFHFLYTRDRAVGTLDTYAGNHDGVEEFQVLPEGNFVFWGSKERGLTVEMTAFSASGEAVVGDFIAHPGFHWKYVAPKDVNFKSMKNVTVVEGDHVAFISNNLGAYAHFLADHLGYWAYLKESFPETTKFIFADMETNHLFQQNLEIIDPEFSKRVQWIQCDCNVNCNQMIQVRNGDLTVVKNVIPTRHMELFYKAREWTLQSYPPKTETLEKKTIVYYTRNSPTALHARQMDVQQEEVMVRMIQNKIKEYGRTEEFVVFRGSESFEEQVALFRSASVIIGPHGGGMANLFWALPSATCEERPKVLEFLISPDTPEIQPEGGIAKTYWTLFNTAPWLEFHHVFYVPPSNRDTLYVNLFDFEDALDDIFKQ